MKKPTYTWNEELGIAKCTIYCNNLEFYGSAHCHPDDEDMMSKLTGQTIAEARALIEYLRHIRDNELRPQIKILYQLYYNMKHSKEYSPRGYEAKMLYKQIVRLEEDLTNIKEQIELTKNFIREYIDKKDESYKVIRSYKAKKN
jgi:hypothetical protein